MKTRLFVTLSTWLLALISLVASQAALSDHHHSLPSSNTQDSTPAQQEQEISDQQENNKIRIQDSYGKWAFDKPPKRVAVINWTLTEQLLELGVTPVAVADYSGFKEMSPQTKQPEDQASIIDLGSRFSPNLAQLKASNPEIIIIGYSQRDLLRPLSNIAPVMYFNNFRRRSVNSERADEHYRTLAKLFDQTEFAEQKMTQRDLRIAQLKQQLSSAFQETGKSLPKVTVASKTDNEVLAYLNNSLPFAVLTKLGLESELSHKPTKFGTQKLNSEQLNQLQGCLIFFDHRSEEATNTKSSPHPKCQIKANNANTFGGAMSVLHLAESIYSALINFPAEN